jgi:hypothetical protein
LHSIYSSLKNCFRQGEIQSACGWPGSFDWLAGFTIAVAAFALEAYIAIAIGQAQNLSFDGLAYANHARIQYYRFAMFWPNPFRPLFGFYSDIAGLWSGFIVLTYVLVGVGETQAYFSGFWPTFALVVLVIWVARVYGGRTIAILLGAATALLPFNSPSISMAIAWFLGSDSSALMRSVMADLRPDRLAHIFMLWSVLPLLLHGQAARWSTFAITGLAAAASVLTKGTTAPLTVGCWGLAILYTVWLQRISPANLARQAKHVLVGCLFFFLPLVPWFVVGGFSNVLDYVRNTYLLKPFYEQSVTTAAFQHFPFRDYFLLADFYFTWPVFGLLFVVSTGGLIVAIRSKAKMILTILVGLILVGGGILLALWVQPLSNAYLAMPFYLVFWMIFVVTVASLWARHGAKTRFARPVIAGGALGLIVVAGMALAGALSWPQDDLQRQLQSRALLRDIASDIRSHLTDRDMFASLSLSSGFPLIFQFHMMTDAPVYPGSFRIWAPDGPGIAGDPEARQRFITDLETQAKLIITFKEPPGELYHGKPKMSDFFFPHFNAIYEYLPQTRADTDRLKNTSFLRRGDCFFLRLPEPSSCI